MNWLAATRAGVVLTLHVVPRSSQTVVQGIHGDAVKVRLQAPPVDGKANEALLRFLSQCLGIPPRQLRLVTGMSGRRKRVLVIGLGESEIREKLGI